ncbi:FAD/NAD(P)-binding domain-containing protein [Mycena venus]|uniref:FAD/NAD(P)-binding domain-containing protein n=1 Tax=Mycena venus TaxID=2733690 RepID=A0A8H6Y1W9_9AGAR|nr:FAD/NAD(P)-binding domain-containing protein [Mycena venus]
MKILLNAEVRRLIFGANGDESVTVQLGDKDKTEIKAKRVVLCAGSVHSAAILLRSDVDLESHLHLTDHAMYLVKHFFRYRESNRGKDVGPMKLQTFTKLDDENPVLANFTVDASAFLSSSEANFTPDLSSSEANITSADHFALLSTRVTFAMDVSEPHSVNSPGNPDYQHIFTMVFALSSKLGDENKIVCKDEEEPTITIKRTDVANAKMLEAMRRMVDEGVVETMKKELGAEFDPAPTKTTEQQLEKPLGLGNVAHEVGSLPMGDSTGAVDADLKLRAHKNIYVCDLSVFPVSPAANPSLTLAALALRLSHHLLSVM